MTDRPMINQLGDPSVEQRYFVLTRRRGGMTSEYVVMDRLTNERIDEPAVYADVTRAQARADALNAPRSAHDDDEWILGQLDAYLKREEDAWRSAGVDEQADALRTVLCYLHGLSGSRYGRGLIS